MDSPLDYLFELRDRREQKGIWPWIPFVILGVLTVPAANLRYLFLNIHPPSNLEMLSIYIAWFTSALMLYPAFFRPLLCVYSNAVTLESRLTGSSKEELWGTGMTPQSIVDGPVKHSLKGFLTRSLPQVFVLLVPTVIQISVCGDGSFGHLAYSLAKWLLLTPLLVGSVGYFFRIRSSVAPAGLANLIANCSILGSLYTAISLVAILHLSQEYITPHSPIIVEGTLYFAYFLVLSILRKWAITTVHRNAVRPVLVNSLSKNRWVPVWSTHPIVVRERQRLQNQITAGFLGSLVWHFPTVICTCLVIAQPRVIAMARPEHYVIALFSIGLVQFSRAVWTSLPRIVQEIESRDFESILSTKLTPLQYQFGWTQVILLPIAVDTLLSLAAILATAKDLGPALVVPASVCLSAPVLGVLMGLCSSCANTRSSANQRLVFGLTAFLLMAWQGGLIEKQIAHMIRLQDDPGRWSVLACIWASCSAFAWLTARQLSQRWLNLPPRVKN
jgi:hypothetical protein